jgi:low affinity Fe/Cu permease
VGTPWAFLVAVGLVAGWAISGPLFGFSDTWQLVINTGTTIATFLMVFLIQNTQNRDAKALHLKLDELLRAMNAARNDLIDVEEATDAQLDTLQETYRALREGAPQDGAATPGSRAPERR